MRDYFLRYGNVKVFLSLDFLRIKSDDKVEIVDVLSNQKISPNGKDYIWTGKELQDGIRLHFDGQDATVMKIVRIGN